METADDFLEAACKAEIQENYVQANLLYDRALALQPDYVEAYDNRAKNWLELGEYDKALADFNSVIRIWPNYADAYCDIAWIYLEAEDEELRNVKLALRFAKKSCRLTRFSDHGPVSTLAASLAAAGDLNNAIRWQRKAICLVSKHPSPDIAVFVPYMERRLAEYENQRNEIGNQQRWFSRFVTYWKLLTSVFSK